MRLFSWSEKFYFPEIEIRLPTKKSLSPRKCFYTSIFPSKHFRKMRERERARAHARGEDPVREKLGLLVQAFTGKGERISQLSGGITGVLSPAAVIGSRAWRLRRMKRREDLRSVCVWVSLWVSELRPWSHSCWYCRLVVDAVFAVVFVVVESLVVIVRDWD